MSCSDAPDHTANQAPAAILTACPGCDLLHEACSVSEGHHLECSRCGSTVVKAGKNSVDRVLAFSIAGLLLYAPAMLLPLMTLNSIGMSVSGNVLQTALGFFQGGYHLVAIMVTLTAVLLPLIKLSIACLTALHIRCNKRPFWLKKMFRMLLHLDEWGMTEVYLLAILVTLIKVHDMASIDYGIGFFSFSALVLLSVAASGSIDKELFWTQIGNRNPASVDHPFQPGDIQNEATARDHGLMRCHDCGYLVRQTRSSSEEILCPRCDTTVHLRKKHGVQRTWALVVTSLILVVPANTLPIMQVDFLGIPDRSTILDGIIYFFKEGSYGIGLIIFLASILVPLFKIIGLIIILTTIRSGQDRFLKQKAAMFRFIEFIGRWSMLDIFVIALLTVLVDFGFFTSIHTAPGASFFCMVVVCTMMAAIVFDPRTMWDRCRTKPITSGTYHHE